jgi:FkbM family methyltransferase
MPRLPKPARRTLVRGAGLAYAARRRLRPARHPSGTVVAANEFGSYCVPRASEHRPVAQAILRGEVWEAETLRALCEEAPAADVVHAGTFFGDFLPALARSRRDGARVWGFEPSRENYACATRTIELNELQNVTLQPTGLGDSAGGALLATADRRGVPLGGASRIIAAPSRARWFGSEKVTLVRLDDVIPLERSVGVIHLDVEGHEQAALAGGLATIARCRPLLVLETLPVSEWIEAHLAPLGYVVGDPVNRNFVMRCEPARVSRPASADAS